MKKKNNFRVSALFTAVMLFGAMMFTGCVQEHDADIPTGSGDGGNLYISIKTASISGTTRAGVSITTDPTSASENYMGKALVCIYNSTGDLVQYKEVNDLMSLTDQKVDFSGQAYAANYKVAVVSNLPTNVHNAIKAKLDANATTAYTLDDLQAEQLAIMDALNDDVLTTTDADRRIPMYGEGTIAENDGNYYVSIPVKHSLVKVTLNQLVVDFGESSTRNAIFTPDQVFLSNVPDVVNISADEAIAALDFDAASNPNKMYQGDENLTYVTTAPADATEVQYADADKKKVAITALTGGDNIIGTNVNATPAATDALSSAQSDWNRQYYFYALPNDLTNEDATCLVVTGNFDTTGDGSDVSRVYYSVKLNGNGDDKLEANTNYKVNMIIHGKGAADAYSAAADPTIVEAFVTAVDFEENGQNVILGGGAATYSNQGEIIKVGDILFADGKFKSQADAATYYDSGNGPTPVGIVFHVLNAAEQAAAQYNGKKALVMALKDAGSKSWGPADQGLTRLQLDDTGNADAPADAASMATLRRSVATQLKTLTRDGNNGWLNWNAATNKTDDNAFKACADFDADNSGAADGTDFGTLSTSGWYLPSIGELYKMTYSLGKLQTSLLNVDNMTWGNSSSDATGSAAKNWNWTPWGMYYTNGATAGAQGVADKVRDNINAMIDACGAGTYTAFEGGLEGTTGGSTPSNVHYWSSSEWSGVYAFDLFFRSNGNLHFSRGSDKSNSYRVRPVLAF